MKILVFLFIIASSTFAHALPKHFVLALDGIPYKIVKELQKEEGHFKSFYPVQPLVSTYPSLTGPAFSQLFKTTIPDGYQKHFFNRKLNKSMGSDFNELGMAHPFLLKMDASNSNKFFHVLSFTFPNYCLKREFKIIEEAFFKSQKKDIFYAYIATTDSLGHMISDLKPAMRLTSLWLEGFLSKIKKMGATVDLTIVSDHGNNTTGKAKRLRINSFLKEKGYQVTKTLVNLNDVAYISAGAIDFLAIHCDNKTTKALAKTLTKLEGVDVVSYVLNQHTQKVFVLKKDFSAEVSTSDNIHYQYTCTHGDPLEFHFLKKNATVNFNINTWLDKTLLLKYPNAPIRLYEAHYSIVKNKANILLSLKPGYENVKKWIKIFSVITRRKGGTHGGLSSSSSLGVIMSNTKKVKGTAISQLNL